MARPQTAAELIEWFENNFECFTGQPRAYFEICFGPKFSYDGKANPVIRGVYESHLIKTRDETNAERNLVHVMYQDFAPLAGANHALFWRLPEKISFQRRIVQKFGRQIATQEEVDDGRVVLLPGCVLNTQMSVWCEPDNDSWEWVLRTRLCIPAASWIVVPPMLSKNAEGGETITI